MDDASDDAGRRKVIELIEGVDYALFITRGTDGAPLHARPMAPCKVEGDGDVWFFMKAKSRKVAELRQNPSTLVGFADPRAQHFVTVSGESEVIADADEKRRRWREIYRAWFPKGAEDEDVVLIRVRATRAEYWDTPTSVVSFAVGYVKAVATGTPSRAGEIGSVELPSARDGAT